MALLYWRDSASEWAKVDHSCVVRQSTVPSFQECFFAFYFLFSNYLFFFFFPKLSNYLSVLFERYFPLFSARQFCVTDTLHSFIYLYMSICIVGQFDRKKKMAKLKKILNSFSEGLNVPVLVRFRDI